MEGLLHEVIEGLAQLAAAFDQLLQEPDEHEEGIHSRGVYAVTVMTLAPLFLQHFVDNNGAPLFQGKLSSFAAGTNTPLATYKDSTGLTPNTNPVILNYRGEGSVWIPPNVAYKFNLTDSLGNQIGGYPVDNVVNSQLITLYGGVDTGVSNAYLLNFVASFTAYVDGIIIYWIPANTNSGASTINVNGLGVVNIVNPDGSALTTGEIVVNFPAQILFKGGKFELITPAVPVTGTYVPTWGGFSSPPSVTVSYRRSGNIASIIIPAASGTSNANSFSMIGTPAILRPANSLVVPCPGLADAGTTIITASVASVGNATTITFFKDANLANNWTASGVKGMGPQNTILTYPI